MSLRTKYTYVILVHECIDVIKHQEPCHWVVKWPLEWPSSSTIKHKKPLEYLNDLRFKARNRGCIISFPCLQASEIVSVPLLKLSEFQTTKCNPTFPRKTEREAPISVVKNPNPNTIARIKISSVQKSQKENNGPTTQPHRQMSDLHRN